MTTLPNEKIFNILIVEDNEGDFVLVSEYLMQGLSNCTMVRNKRLQEALVELNNNRFDVVLLDLTLPDSNGVDSIKEVLALVKESPLIVLTGFNDKHFAIESLKLGVDDYLIKDEVSAPILYKSISYSIERKKNQIQLANSEKRFRALIENSTDGLSVLNKDGKVLERSPMGKKILGNESTDDITLQDQLYFAEKEDTLNAFTELAKLPGKVFTSEFRIVTPNKQVKWIENTFHNLLHEPGINAIVANYRDITERKSNESIIKESEEKYRFLYNKNPQAIFIWDPTNFNVIDVNDTSIELYGYSKEEFLQMTILQMRKEEHYPKIKELGRKIIENELESYTTIWLHLKKSGEDMYMQITSQKIFFNGTVAVLAIGNNVTEKINLEKALEKEKIQKQQEITGAVITAQEKERQEIGSELHDNVNQILASSRLYLGLVRKSLATPSKHLDETEKLISSAIDELRKLSHSLIPPSMDETELIDAIEMLFDATTSTTQIQIKNDIVNFDEHQVNDKKKLAIYRIIQEQFNNIIKYAKASTVAVTLKNIDNNGIHLSIKDDGIGFDTAQKQKGVGLLNMKVRASLFNGDVTILSSIGNGCELLVVFK
jgi:PAS domain S-box-containing protein